MRKIALIAIACLFSYALVAQEGAKKRLAKKTNSGGKKVNLWKKGGMFNLNINQGGYDNWISAGDADWSIGLNGAVSLFANRGWEGKRQGKVKSWTNNLDIFEAIQSIHDERTDANTFNKLNDRIDGSSKYSVQIKDKINFATLLNLRTQLYDTKVGEARKSGFFAPATITFAPGFEWKPNSWFNMMLSPFSNRWIIISNGPYSLVQGIPDAKPFGVDPVRKVDWQPGAFAQLNLNRDLGKAKKVNWRSRLDLYSNYAGKAANVDMFFDNYVSFKVTKWISAGINLTMAYDDDIKQFGWNRDKAGLQYNHNIGIGLTRKF